MSAAEKNGSDRRAMIAASAVHVIARDGLRSLTHRAVDREAAIPQGSTSYYAPTRHALLELVVSVLAERSIADAERAMTQLRVSMKDQVRVDALTLAARIDELVTVLTSRPDDMKVRYALLLELEAGALRDRLTEKSDVHTAMIHAVGSVLSKLGSAHPESHAVELITLTDSLVLHRIMSRSDTSFEPIIKAYLLGIVDGSAC